MNSNEKEQVIRVLRQTAEYMPVEQIAEQKAHEALKAVQATATMKTLIDKFRSAEAKIAQYEKSKHALRREIEAFIADKPLAWHESPGAKLVALTCKSEAALRRKIDKKLNELILRVLSSSRGDEELGELFQELTEMEL